MPDGIEQVKTEYNAYVAWLKQQYPDFQIPKDFENYFTISDAYRYWISQGRPSKSIVQPEVTVEPAPEATAPIDWQEYDIMVEGQKYKVNIPIFSVDQLTQENIVAALGEGYDPSMLPQIYQASSYLSMATYLMEQKNVTPSQLNTATDLQDLMIDWSGKISQQGISGQGFAQFVETISPPVPKRTVPLARIPTGAGGRYRELPHLVRVSEIEKATGKQANELYQQDIEAMKQAADTGKGVMLSTGGFDPFSAGFTETNPLRGQLREAPGGQYYTGQQGVTVHLPNIENWSDEAYKRSSLGGMPRAVSGIEASRLSEAEKAGGVQVGERVYPKGFPSVVPVGELAKIQRLHTPLARELARKGAEKLVTGEFKPGGTFIQGVDRTTRRQRGPTPWQQRKTEWEDLVRASKSRPQRIARL